MSKAQKVQINPRVKTGLKFFYILPVVFVLALCGFLVWSRVTNQGPPVRHISAQPFTRIPIHGLTANLYTEGDQLRAAGNDLFIEFRDGQSNLTDVGDVTFQLAMKMPDMVMHSMGKVLRTATPGQYRTTVDPQMGGDWTGTIGFAGTHGNAETNFPVKVR